MLEKYFTNITEKEYRESPEISYSFLKSIATLGGEAYVEEKLDGSMPSLALGSLVDSILTSNDEYSYEDDFIISAVKKDRSSTTQIKKLVNYIIENHEEEVLEDSIDIDRAIEIADDAGLFTSYKKPETKRKYIDVDDLWNQLNIHRLEQSGKTIISQEDFELAMEMVETLKSHDFTKHIFGDTDLKRYYQAKIFFTINKVPIKSMLDIILVDEEKKIIYPYDLKTGTDKDFMKNFFAFKYYYQGALYTSAIQSIVQTKPEFEGYKVEPFRFVYISRYSPNKPLVYEMSEDYIEKVMTGFQLPSKMRIEGVLDLLADHEWYVKNNITDYSRDIYENGGVKKIINPF